MHSKIEFNAKARARNLELPNGDRLSPHRALPARSFVSFLCPSPFSRAPPSLALYVAYLRYRSQIQSRDSGADISHARGAPQSFVPKCEVGSQARVDCRIPRGRSLVFYLFSLFFFLLFFFHSCKLAGNRSRLAPRLPAAAVAAGSWLARLHKYYANIWSSPVTPRARAKSLRSCRSAGLCRRAVVDAKCRCLFPPRYARLASLPYRP